MPFVGILVSNAKENDSIVNIKSAQLKLGARSQGRNPFIKAG